MDHKWGRNVTLFGLVGTGCTLASRYPVPNHNFCVTNEYIDGVHHRIWQIPADTQPDLAYFAFTTTGGPAHFPYGQQVEPDAPV